MSAGISGHLRPDERLLVRPTDEWTPRAAREAVELAMRLGMPAVTHVDERAVAERAALTDAGFSVARRDAHVVFAVERALQALQGAEVPAGISIRSAADVDEDEHRLLDDELRQDVPGTAGWRSTPEQFHVYTFTDPAFDPRTYLIAVDDAAGEPLGLVRIWMNPAGPRLGKLGVRRAHRRRGIGSALLAHALRAVHTTGATEVSAEHDLTNRASAAIAKRLGARRVRRVVELVYEPGSPRRAAPRPQEAAGVR